MNDETQLAIYSQKFQNESNHLDLYFITKGTLLSLKGSHEEAIMLFKKSRSLNSHLVSYTDLLLGYEYLLLEEYDSAENCFSKVDKLSLWYSKAVYVPIINI
jgi:tetratricopeptide (TPR) repeat protein